jgi:hypothetical protein
MFYGLHICAVPWMESYILQHNYKPLLCGLDIRMSPKCCIRVQLLYCFWFSCASILSIAFLCNFSTQLHHTLLAVLSLEAILEAFEHQLYSYIPPQAPFATASALNIAHIIYMLISTPQNCCGTAFLQIWCTPYVVYTIRIVCSSCCNTVLHMLYVTYALLAYLVVLIHRLTSIPQNCCGTAFSTL